MSACKSSPKSTKPIGYVYFIECVFEEKKKKKSNDDSTLCKIGRTKSDPEKRLKQLQTGNPFTLKLICALKDENYGAIEKQFHTYYKEERVRGEWFMIPNVDLKIIIEEATESKKYDKKKDDMTKNDKVKVTRKDDIKTINKPTKVISSKKVIPSIKVVS